MRNRQSHRGILLNQQDRHTGLVNGLDRLKICSTDFGAKPMDGSSAIAI
jgi:hypothetical protein